jgi:16S rRNA (adenine1518-N6/adenine1519-N6)-dimethyltransferase
MSLAVEGASSDGLRFPPDPRRLLRAHRMRPKKALGQNFLVERGALLKVLRAADLVGDETVLEVGAGLGTLTYLLAQRARKVLAVEYDRQLIPLLERVLAPFANVRILAEDILHLDLAALLDGEPFCVVANIPYQITSILLRKLMESEARAQKLVLTVQREVAERVIAGVGGMNLLALGVQLYGQAEIVDFIPPAAFYPSPKVQSAVLRIIPYHEQPLDRQEVDQVFRLARAAFSQKRKQLRNSLAAGLGRKPDWAAGLLERAGIDPRRRPQDLSLEEWIHLARTYRQEVENP